MTWKQSFQLYLRTLGYFRESLPKVALQLSLMVVGVELGVLSVFPLAILIDGVFGNKRSVAWEHRLFFALAPASIPGQVVALAAVTLALRLGQEVLTMFQTLLGIKVGYSGLMKVRHDLFKKLQELQLAYHRGLPQGDAIYRLSYDCFGFQTILNLVVQTVLVSVLTLLLMLATMISTNWQLTLIALSVAPALLWTSSHYGKVFHKKAVAAKEADSALTTAIQRSVASIELVQAFNREADELARFQNSSGQSVRTWLKLHWEEVCYWLLVGTIFGVGGALMFGYGGWLVYKGRLTVGELSIFIGYLGQLYGPLNKLSGSGSSFQSGIAGVQRVFEVLDRDVTIADAKDAVALPLRPRVLEFDHVALEYRAGEPVLRDVTARISPGEMVAFVGASGVGKTSLLNLLPRFYDPTSGTLKLDEHDLRRIKLRHLRRHVALVLQEHSILPATVWENIAYGHTGASQAAIAAAAKLAGAAEFIEKLPEKYFTRIGEGFAHLSGGQRQRIGIARAILTEAPILVLDEPTSALDPQHEAMIVQTLANMKGKRTIILVSHRLSTVSECDQIFVMDDGRVAERGTHKELLSLGGLYRAMAAHQFKMENDEPVEAKA